MELITQDKFDDLVIEHYHFLKDPNYSGRLDLENCQLKGIKFPRDASFMRVVHCQLEDLDVTGSNLSFIDFSGSTITESDFNMCSLLGANFTRASINNTSFIGCNIGSSKFNEANLNNIICGLSNINNSEFYGTSLKSIHLMEVEASKVKGLNIITIENPKGIEGRVTYIPKLGVVYLPYTQCLISRLKKVLKYSGVSDNDSRELYNYFNSFTRETA